MVHDHSQGISPTYIRRNPQTLLLFLQTFFLLKGKLDWHVPNTVFSEFCKDQKMSKSEQNLQGKL